MKKIVWLSVMAVLFMQPLAFADNLWAAHVRQQAVWNGGYSDYIVKTSYGSPQQKFLDNVENFFNMNSRITSSENLSSCAYTPSGWMTLYGGNWGESCEPKFVTYPKYWTPTPFLIVGKWGEGYTYTAKPAPNDAEFRNNVGMVGTIFTPQGADRSTFTFEPVVDENETATNNSYNDYGNITLLRPTEYSKLGTNFQNVGTQKSIKYDINPGAELNDITEFKQGLARRNLTARLLSREKISQGGGEYNLYWFPQDAKFQTEGVKNYIFGVTGSGSCKHTYANGSTYGSGKECKNYSNSAGHTVKTMKPFAISFFADVIPGLSQINKWVYIRPNGLVKTDNLGKQNYGLQGFAGANGQIRFGIIPREVVQYKIGGDRDNVDFKDLKANFRPNIAYHLNYVAFTGNGASLGRYPFDWTAYLKCGTNGSKPYMCNKHATGGSVGRSRDGVAIDKSNATKKHDLNGYTSGQYYQGTAYRLRGDAVGKDAQMNSVFYSNGGQFPYQSDNRYAYYLDIGFCGDGLIQSQFGEKCDGENCSKDCQKFEVNKCGNGKIDKIGEYTNKEWKQVPVYEQCDYKMFVNDEINKTINSTSATGKYDGFNNPCYAPEEKETAKKYGRTACQWKVPEATISVVREDGELNKDKLPKEVVVENYPAWATTKDIRIFKYLFKKQNNSADPDIETERTKINALPYSQKVTYLSGKDNPNMLHQSLLDETFNDKLCSVLSANEGSADKLCSSPKIEPKTWNFNCNWYYGMVNPKYTAPFYTMLPPTWQKIDQWRTSPAGLITPQLIPNGFKNVLLDSTKLNAPFNFYKLGNQLANIGVGATKASISTTTKLLANNNGNFQTGNCQKVYHPDSIRLDSQYYVHLLGNDQALKKAMPATMSDAEKEKYTIRPIYWAMLYNNVALAYGFQVFNLTTEFDNPQIKDLNLPVCSENGTKLKDLWNGKKEIDLQKTYKNFLNVPNFKTGAVCAWVKEEGKTPISLGGWNINFSFRTPSGEQVNLKCINGEYFAKNVDKMKFTFQRNKKNANTWLKWAVHTVFADKTTTGYQVRQGAKICIASLDGGISVEKCDVANFQKWDEQPNPTPLNWGNIGNLVGVNAY